MSASNISILSQYTALFFLIDKTPVWVYLRMEKKIYKKGTWRQSLQAQVLQVPDLSTV